MSSLPIDEVLPDVVRHLKASSGLVLIAPPGAGKTTRLPSALVDQGVVGARQRVLVLEPRRLAARLAAKRIAEERGVRLGGEVGYQVRFDDRTSASSRIVLVTEGILTRGCSPTLFWRAWGRSFSTSFTNARYMRIWAWRFYAKFSRRCVTISSWWSCPPRWIRRPFSASWAAVRSSKAKVERTR